MVSTKQLKAINKKRDNLIGILAIMAVPAPFIAVGAAFIIGGIQKGPLYMSLIGLHSLVLGCVIGWVLFQNAYQYKKLSYKMFMDNDVFVDPKDPKLRAVELIALEKCRGDLKHALRYVAVSPELHRQERFQLMLGWCDYERDYIYTVYGKDPMRVAKASKTDPLTIATIELDLSRLSRRFRKDDPVFTVKLAACTDKSVSHGTDGEADEYYLHFGSNGRCECNLNIYGLTEKGDTFYIVTVEGKKSPSLAYPTAEWTANEALNYLMDDE